MTTKATLFLKIAKDEAKTLIEYQEMLDELDEPLGDNEQSIVNEIMSDEFNHCLVALLSASKIIGVPIATDNVDSGNVSTDIDLDEELGELDETLGEDNEE